MIDHSQETTFVYKPGRVRTSLRDANVRRRLQAANPQDTPDAAKARVSRFLKAREVVESTLEAANTQHSNTSLAELSQFLANSRSSTQLSTVFTLKAEPRSLMAAISQAEPSWETISIHSKECPNFKAAAKLIVNRLTESRPELILDRRLTYDFHVLIDWLRAQDRDPWAGENLVVLVEDADSFDPSIMRDLISHLASYVANQELNIHLMLNISVPLPLIEEQLSQDNIVAMRVHVLTGQPSTSVYVKACTEALSNSEDLQLVLTSALTQQLEQLEVSQASKRLNYAVLAHFAGNPLASVRTVADLRAVPFVLQLPSVHAMCSESPAFLEALPADYPLRDLSELVPELQVGGTVLDLSFKPNYRPLMEQALTDPRAFGGAEDSRMASPTSVLYQLSRESSVFINIYDLYCAFKEMVNPVEGVQDGDWDKQSMAIFLESMAALKMNGILRDCKRKFECVEKVSWKGV